MNTEMGRLLSYVAPLERQPWPAIPAKKDSDPRDHMVLVCGKEVVVQGRGLFTRDEAQCVALQEASNVDVLVVKVVGRVQSVRQVVWTPEKG